MSPTNIVGGRAHGKGVSFYSKRFAVTAFREKSKVKLYVKKRKTGKKRLFSDFNLPFLRGVFRLGEILWFAGWIGRMIFFLFIAWMLTGIWSFWQGTGVILSTSIPFLGLDGKGWVLLGVGLLWIRFSPLSQYHGAEHKVYNAVLEGMDLTVENVRRASRISKQCGTNLAVIYTLFHVALTAFLPAPFAFLCGFSIAWEIFRLKNSPWTSWIFTLGGSIQHYLVTVEPTDQQLEVAIASMAELLRQEKEE